MREPPLHYNNYASDGATGVFITLLQSCRGRQLGHQRLPKKPKILPGERENSGKEKHACWMGTWSSV